MLCKGGANAKAIADFSAAIQLQPNEGLTYCYRGEALVQQGDFDKGIADMSEAIRLEPKNAARYLGRSNAWYRKGGAEAQELADLDAATRLDPQRDYGYIHRGTLYLRRKEYAKAVADFDMAEKLKTRDGNLYLFRAVLLAQCPDATYRDGKRAVAEANKGRAMLERPGWYAAQVLAAAHAEAGDFEQAARWQERALADPSFTYVDDGQRRLELYRNMQPYRLP